MRQYLELVKHIVENGVDKGDRTGTGTRSVFGHQMRFNLLDGFPIVTAKQTAFKLVVSELLWFLKGNPNIDYLHEHNNHIWDEWVKEDGTFGPIYGEQWRSWPNPVWVEDKGAFPSGGTGHDENQPIDQIADVIERLKTNPNDRRMIVSAWNVADVNKGDMALPPCHVMFQFYTAPMSLWDRVRTHGYVTNDMAVCISPGKITQPERLTELLDEADVPTLALSCQLYQRSCDTFLGVPFNIASYALLTHMIARVTGMGVGDFIWTGGDVHLYSNHQLQVAELLTRPTHKLPKLQLDLGVDNIDGFKPEDIWLEGYKHSGSLKAPVAV